MSLILPPPVNHVSNGNDIPNGRAISGADHEASTAAAPAKASKYIEGLIYPPPDIRTIIDRTAAFVARSANPPQFEEKIREKHRQDPKFSFVNPTDSYHAYYRHRIDRIQSGEEDDIVQDDKKDGQDAIDAVGQVDGLFETGKSSIPKEPPPQDFVLDKPSLSALDHDVLKLTALFAARQGPSFLSQLTAREGRNYQFDFLRPNHSLFGYFNRILDQYTKILIPPPETLERLAELKGDQGRWKLLEGARQRAEWEQYRREREKKRNDDQEAEKQAFSEIDWHDFAIVQTIDFTAADASSELPPPMSIAEVESMTLAQKKMAAMIMDDTAPEVEAIRAAQAVADAGAAEDAEMVDSAAVEAAARAEAEKQREEEEADRAKAVQAMSSAPMKIRKDYVPKSLAARNAAKTAMTTCSICGQQVPIDELDEHMRIELLDPRWKTQRDALEARRATANEQQLGANVVASLKQLIRVQHDDEADAAARKRIEAESEARRKEKDKIAWDGFTATKEGTVTKYQSNVNFDEQIASIWKAKGLGGADPSTTGPGIGPAVGPAQPPVQTQPNSALAPPLALPSSLPANPAYAAATVSSGPQPASSSFGVSYPPPPPSAFPLPPNPMMQQGGFGMPPQSPVPMGVGATMHPSRLAQLQGGPGADSGTSSGIGMTRSAEEMMGGDDGSPAMKRPRVQKLPDGQYYPEADWINFHPEPIKLSIRLPSSASTDVPLKPEWNMDGSVVEMVELPVTLLVSSLRDRILGHIKSTLAASRVKLTFSGRVLTNSMSLATYNLDDGDEIVLDVREAKKKYPPTASSQSKSGSRDGHARPIHSAITLGSRLS
ncbi:SF3a splicing factor complex subunit [Tulasnella sp. JGI-2019a]|nr:SF3a splicing factor complex subunit [Tulasnella sp. JGI-2019a]